MEERGKRARIVQLQQRETNTSIRNLAATMTHEELPYDPAAGEHSMIARAVHTATAQQLRGKVGIWKQSAPNPAEDVVNTRGFKLLIATVTETTRGRHEGESAETFIFRAMLANTPFIHVAVECKKAAARQVKKDAKTGKNQDVSFTIASGSSSQPILEAPKETPPKITTPFDRDTWKVIEERKEASASDLRDAVEERHQLRLRASPECPWTRTKTPRGCRDAHALCHIVDGCR